MAWVEGIRNGKLQRKMLEMQDREARSTLFRDELVAGMAASVEARRGQEVQSEAVSPGNELDTQEERDRLMAERLALEWALEAVVFNSEVAPFAAARPAPRAPSPAVSSVVQASVPAADEHVSETSEQKDGPAMQEAGSQTDLDCQANDELIAQAVESERAKLADSHKKKEEELQQKEAILRQLELDLNRRETGLQKRETQLDSQAPSSDNQAAAVLSEDDRVPKDFICPITHDVMKDPVLAMDGHSYERWAMDRW